MNDIGAGVTAQVLASAAVTKLIADRMTPDVIPQGRGRPACCYTVISDTPEHDLRGAEGISQARVQFDVYATTRKESNEIAERIRLAIDGQTGTWGGEFVRTCNLQNTTRTTVQPINGSAEWDYVTTQDYLVWYIQTLS